MSDRFHFTYTGITMAIFGVALLIIGGLLTYYALSIEWVVGPRILTPIGIVVALLGLLILTSKEG
jgi:protein-S-isoprenylcysteine O-methyltransferase Ste14